jgi:hypothetical protein
LDSYIERIKAIKWFNPEKFDQASTDKQIKIALKAFGVEATIEYRALNTAEDWGAAWGAARGAARDAAWGAAWGAARDAARDAAWGAADLLASFTPDGKYAGKYPDGNFLRLIPLWEQGLYPCGVIDGKFVCYVPGLDHITSTDSDALEQFSTDQLQAEIDRRKAQTMNSCNDCAQGNPHSMHTHLAGLAGVDLGTVMMAGEDLVNNVLKVRIIDLPAYIQQGANIAVTGDDLIQVQQLIKVLQQIVETTESQQ